MFPRGCGCLPQSALSARTVGRFYRRWPHRRGLPRGARRYAELLQTLEQLIQLRLLGKHLTNKRSVIRHIVGERSLAVRQRIVKRDDRVVAEFAVEAVSVAQSPFAARAEACTAVLHAFPQCRAPGVILAILVLRDLVPLLVGFVVDAIGFRFFFSFSTPLDLLESAEAEPSVETERRPGQCF